MPRRVPTTRYHLHLTSVSACCHGVDAKRSAASDGYRSAASDLRTGQPVRNAWARITCAHGKQSQYGETRHDPYDKTSAPG